MFFFFKQKTAYEMRISDWSSDVCSSDLREEVQLPRGALVDIGFSADEAKGIKTFKGKGCMACSETGYKGRIAIYEVMGINEQLKDAKIGRASCRERVCQYV